MSRVFSEPTPSPPTPQFDSVLKENTHGAENMDPSGVVTQAGFLLAFLAEM